MTRRMADVSPTNEEWLAPPRRLRLEAGEVHVWRASLNQSEAIWTASLVLLSDDERERADRFRFPRDRERYTVAHAALRDILGRYLRIPAGEIAFCHGPYGKPALSGDGGGLDFNLSHSHELALYAVARARPVGIDVERVRELETVAGVAERFFSAEEVSVLNNLPSSRRAAAFFDCWTRKEAYVKARGEGLSRQPSSFTVSFAEGETATMLHADADDVGNAEWSLFSLSPCAGYAAALAVAGRAAQLSCWQWPGFDASVGRPRRPR